MIADHHLAMLAASGITPEHAARRGYQTIDDEHRLAELRIVTAARCRADARRSDDPAAHHRRLQES